MSTLAAPATPSHAQRGRVAQVLLWALQVVLVVVYVFSGFMKVSLDPSTVAGFAAMGFSPAGCVTIGSLELLGAAALLIPRLAGLAATALTALMIGAVISMTAIGGGVYVAIPATVLVLVAVVAVVRRHETAALVRAAIGRIRR